MTATEAVRIIRCALLLSTLLVGCGCRQKKSSPTDPMAVAVAPTAHELAAFSAQSGIVLPASVQPLRFYSEGGIDTIVFVQFRLPAAQLPKFIASIPIPAAQVHVGHPADSTAYSSFRPWLSVAPKKFQFVDTSTAPGRYVKGVFVLDDPKTVMVYLTWFTT